MVSWNYNCLTHPIIKIDCWTNFLGKAFARQWIPCNKVISVFNSWLNGKSFSHLYRGSNITVQTSMFFLRKSFKESEPQKPKNLKKMLRKSPASNAWAAIFKNADFS